MQPRPVSREQSRQIDRRATEQYGIPSLILMENAGRGVADVLGELGIPGPVVVCCGKGNNAGDGFVLARHLDLRGHPVRVLVWADPPELAGDAGVNFEILRKTDVPIVSSGRSRVPCPRLRGHVVNMAAKTWPCHPTWRRNSREPHGSSMPCWGPGPAASPGRRWTA